MHHAYGSWPSPITAESLTAGTLALGDPILDQDDLWWPQADPTDGGRVSLHRLSLDRGRAGTETEVTPAPFNVRSRVHEYGGGAFAVADGTVVFSDFASNRLYLLSRDETTPRPLTTDPELRYGALQIDPARDLLVAVREDHRGDGEPINTVIARRLSDSPEIADRVLCAGADFYAGPQLSASRLAWIEWQHPNMPWDSTRLRIADLPLTGDGTVDLEPRTGTVLAAKTILGETEQESVGAPTWAPDGSLIFVSDRTDWWNLYRWDPAADRVQPLCPMDAEFAPPMWALGGRPYVIIDDDRIGCAVNRGNRTELGILTVSDGELNIVDTRAVDVGSLTCNGQQLGCRLGFADRPSELVIIDLGSSTGPAEQAATAVTPSAVTTVRRSSDATLPTDLVSIATAVSWESELGTVHGWYYPPTNADLTAPDGELPPMITISHGGPTAGSSPAYARSIQFWTSRGIAVLDVNYGGSTGYGRRYRERLRRQWGEVDVTDCADGARAMADQGRADRRRLAIQGGSAGGYTTLRALTATDVFTAGISHYGIGDLTALVADTHKFESRYPESLVGRWPEEAELYADRSPINHVDQLTAPILLTQGTEDKVVPPNQAETFAAAARAKGLPVALIMYAGEGHGFRRAENIISSQQATLAFLGRIFGFTPADQLPDLEIENLPPGNGS
ncbi:S9 family peptidase [Microlunatus soli]|uniref:Prolyl oligopeptidase family protein n=1 Tax=Microlunatus soli TaxID=630515 RepID=A0A1H1Z4G7_9ACTN|nr:prolyl oligopeptidase family serine peptidase [Microlunatus soli]SDT28560.1 Prolyl oligopeptidase family protein [Microlunatus soli]